MEHTMLVASDTYGVATIEHMHNFKSRSSGKNYDYTVRYSMN
jgi:hypothetical protein